MKYVVTINDKNYEVEVERGEARVLAVTAAAPAPAAAVQTAPAVPQPAPAAAAPASQPVLPTTGGHVLRAPMPGMIMNVLKKPGDPIQIGDVVLIMEAMKMENEIVATHSGTLAQIHVAKGANVTTGDPLVTIG